MSFENAGSTRLSMLWGLAGEDDLVRSAYLARFAEQYTTPIVDYLVRTKRQTEADAHDLVQSFWLAKLLTPPPDQNLVAKFLLSQQQATSGRPSSFRLYLLRSVSNFLLDALRKTNRISLQSLDEVDYVDAVSPRDAAAFDAAWANRLLRSVVNGVHQECIQSNQLDLWDLFLRQILWPRLTDTAPPGYAQLASKLGFRDARSASNAVRTVIRKFRSHMQQCISDYLPSRSLAGLEAYVDEEFGEIMSVLTQPGALDLAIFSDLLKGFDSDSVSGGAKSQQHALHFSHAGMAGQGSFIQPVESSLYRTDSDIAFRWQQVLSTSVKQWLDSHDEYVTSPTLTADSSFTFSSLVKGEFLVDQAIVSIRDVAKRAAREPEDEPVVLYGLIYLLAIAAGFKHFNCIYSSDPPEKIKSRAHSLLKLTWLDEDSRRTLQTFVGIKTTEQ